jgi:hypothetical protein
MDYWFAGCFSCLLLPLQSEDGQEDGLCERENLKPQIPSESFSSGQIPELFYCWRATGNDRGELKNGLSENESGKNAGTENGKMRPAGRKDSGGRHPVAQVIQHRQTDPTESGQ